MDIIEQFMDGRCVFCGELAIQRSYPGSDESYDYCGCVDSVRYYDEVNNAKVILTSLGANASEYRKIIEYRRDVASLDREISKMTAKRDSVLRSIIYSESRIVNQARIRDRMSRTDDADE